MMKKSGMKHEKMEGPKERMKEYGPKKKTGKKGMKRGK